jgi:hypothetical protein
MKTFLSVFFAILAAAAVIFVALSAKARLDQWARAKQMCYAQIATEMDAVTMRVKQEQAETHELAKYGRSLNDAVGVASRADATVQMIQDSQKRLLEIERTLVTILEHKPFGLPLTGDERSSLEFIKGEIAKQEKAK